MTFGTTGDRVTIVDATSPSSDEIAKGEDVYRASWFGTATAFEVRRVGPSESVTLASVSEPIVPDATLPMAFAPDGRLLVAGPTALYSLDSKAPSTPVVVASGFSAPRSLFVDSATNDIWLIDREPGADVAHRIRSNVSRDEAPGFLLPSRVDGVAVVVRDGRSWNLEGRLVYTSNGSLVIVEPYGPAGPPITSTVPFTGGTVAGVNLAGAAVVATNEALFTLDDTSKPTAPATLRQTNCVSASITGAIPYDVASPLWSDGADKERGIVLPPNTQARVMPDGDLKFPVGTIAIKTFSRGGRKIETRLLVQHAQDDWVGYSYAWHEGEGDADLVIGNAVRNDWYFPSSGDCNACHTAAAGFTLGLDARQLDDESKKKLAPSASQSRFAPNDARAYLHSNCSMCHREGNATGRAELDLRFDTPLGKTGLCNEPKVGSLGIDRARIVTPGDPAKSVLVKRMRATDETRMPKLATHVVDEAGVKMIEDWISKLVGCQ